MTTGPGGVRAALEQALDAEGDDDAAAILEQAGLFDDDLDVTETGALDAPSPLTAALTPARRGRPKGSRNRRTEATVRWLLTQHRHPLSVMAEAYSMSPAALADAIGLPKTKGEAGAADYHDAGLLMELFKLQMRMAEAVAPFVAQKLPQAVQLDARGGLSISFEGVSLPARAGGSSVAGAIDGDAMGLRLPFKSEAEVGSDS